MRPTEELRRMLDEHDVCYTALTKCVTQVKSGDVTYRIHEDPEGKIEGLLFTTGRITPKQAVDVITSDRNDSAAEWLWNYQCEHDNLKSIGPNELRQLACALHDDIPFGYEASMRLCCWLLNASLNAFPDSQPTEQRGG